MTVALFAYALSGFLRGFDGNWPELSLMLSGLLRLSTPKMAIAMNTVVFVLGPHHGPRM